ncbi:2OG-Fe(II) oxygenase [Halomonas denitrificans]|nr:2OG-Fe(II) oxygenase [Halomonas denitrificans]
MTDGPDFPFREPFPPGRTAPCFCGSGQRFKHCCVAAGREGRVPHGIGIVPDFLDEAECKAICDELKDRPSERLLAVDHQRSNAERTVRKLDDRRVTDRVEVGDLQARLDGWVERALAERIGPAVGREFAWYEEPYVLKYNPSGFFVSHADSDTIDPAAGRWKKVLDRDVSLLIYLNDEYTGGRLDFEHFEFSLRPKAGMLVHFPSDMRYQHAARPVESGLRFAIVSWAAFTDSKRVKTRPPDEAKML